MKSNKKSIGINTVADLISQKWCNDTSHPRCSSKNLLLPQLSRGGIYAPLLEAGRAFWLLWLMEQEGSDITLLLRLGHKKPTWLFLQGPLCLKPSHHTEGSPGHMGKNRGPQPPALAELPATTQQLLASHASAISEAGPPAPRPASPADTAWSREKVSLLGPVKLQICHQNKSLLLF